MPPASGRGDTPVYAGARQRRPSRSLGWRIRRLFTSCLLLSAPRWRRESGAGAAASDRTVRAGRVAHGIGDGRSGSTPSVVSPDADDAARERCSGVSTSMMSIFGMSDMPASRYDSMFGFTICPVTRSRMRSFEQREVQRPGRCHRKSGSRRSGDRRSIRNPETVRIRFTLTMPVSMSTSTSVNCTPACTGR